MYPENKVSGEWGNKNKARSPKRRPSLSCAQTQRLPVHGREPGNMCAGGGCPSDNPPVVFRRNHLVGLYSLISLDHLLSRKPCRFDRHANCRPPHGPLVRCAASAQHGSLYYNHETPTEGKMILDDSIAFFRTTLRQTVQEKVHKKLCRWLAHWPRNTQSRQHRRAGPWRCGL